MVLLSANFTVKIWVVFFRNTGNFLGGRVKEWMVFILKPTKSIGSSKYGTRNLQNITPYERSARFYVTITGNFESFQYFNFETNFLENANSFPKTGEQNISIQNCHIRIQCLDKQSGEYKMGLYILARNYFNFLKIIFSI